MKPQQSIRSLFAILLIWTSGQCYAGAFDPDTIDHWQVYNGTALVFGGHDSPFGTEFQGRIKRTGLKDLIIHFNHCTPHHDIDVTIEIADENGKNILTKTFENNSGKMTINRKELGQLTAKSIAIRYREKNGTDRILGRIHLI